MAMTVMATTKKNMKTIQEEAQHNIELQTVILSAIADYKAQKASSTGSLTEMVANRRKRKTLPGGDGAADDGDNNPENLVADATLRLDRNKSHWSKWSLDLLKKLLWFCSPQRMTQKWLLQFKDKSRLLEVLEYAFDLKVMGETPDKPATLVKADLFIRMRALYIQLGRRMDSLVDSVEGGWFNWREIGVYRVEITEDPDPLKVKLRVYSRILRTYAALRPEVTQGDTTLSQALVVNNYSQSSAYLQTGTDTYLIQNLFPALGRSLRRRISAEAGVASDVAGVNAPAPLANAEGSSSVVGADAHEESGGEGAAEEDDDEAPTTPVTSGRSVRQRLAPPPGAVMADGPTS